MSTTPQAAPKPVGQISAVVGIVAALAWIVPTPAIAYPLPLALGAIAALLAYVGSIHENHFSLLGFFGGLAGLAAGVTGYQQYADAMELLNSGLGL